MQPIYKPKVKAPGGEAFYKMVDLVRANKLNTVCQEAACPNIGECWTKGSATFMILGKICTRACRFCNVLTGRPDKLDPHEPANLAKAVKTLQLSHVVITSVDRDDLEDGGANHFVECVKEIRNSSPNITIEILTPDFLGKPQAANIIAEAALDVFNHNIETVPRLYASVRPKARYFNSLALLNEMRKLNKHLFTKSGIMVGLGETKEEVLQVMDDLRAAQVDIMTIGQYLQPTPKHIAVDRFVDLKEFDYYHDKALEKGFLMVSSSPLTRSSYHAEEHFVKLKKLRYAC